jgi:hypothetical protein
VPTRFNEGSLDLFYIRQMREFTTTIQEELTRGLSPVTRTRLAKYLTEAFNLRVAEEGLEPFEEVVDPFEGGGLGFPFPQLIRGDEITLLFDETSVAHVNEGVVPWTTTPITTVSTSDGATPSAIVSGGEWHFADLKTAWYAFNGETVVFRTGLDSFHGGATKTYAHSAVKISTGCYHKGRVVIGGFDPANFWNAEWQAIFNAWKADAPQGSNIAYNDVKRNYIFWGSIGGGDFPLWLFYPGTASYAVDLGLSESSAIARLKRNEFGFMPLPFQGKVLAVKPIGDRLAVFGEDGMCLLKTYNNELASGYGLDYSTRVGIPDRSFVGGDDKGHVWIDTSGALWT